MAGAVDGHWLLIWELSLVHWCEWLVLLRAYCGPVKKRRRTTSPWCSCSNCFIQNDWLLGTRWWKNLSITAKLYKSLHQTYQHLRSKLATSRYLWKASQKMLSKVNILTFTKMLPNLGNNSKLYFEYRYSHTHTHTYNQAVDIFPEETGKRRQNFAIFTTGCALTRTPFPHGSRWRHPTAHFHT